MRRIELLAVAGAVLVGSQAVAAQRPPLVLEARGGYNVSMGDWNADGLFANGFGVGATVTAMTTRRTGVYVGWEMVRFPVDEEEMGVDADADGTDAGFRAGLASFVPIPGFPAVMPFTELGLVYNTFEAARDGGTGPGVQSEWGLGYEAGVGIIIQAAPRVEVSPIVRYRQHKLKFEGLEEIDPVRYFAFGVGLRLKV